MLGSTVNTCSSSRRTVEVPLSVYRQSGGQVRTVSNCASSLTTLSWRSRPQRFPSCSPLTRCSMSLLRKSSRFSGAGREKLVEIPQLHSSHSCLDKVVHTPVVCNDRCPDGSDVRKLCRFRSFSTFESGRCPCYAGAVLVVMDAPVTMQRRWVLRRMEVPQIQFIADLQTFQFAAETGCSPQLGAMKGFFGAFRAIFRALPVVPEFSASLSSFRALTLVSARGLQGCRSWRELYSQVTRHRDCAN